MAHAPFSCGGLSRGSARFVHDDTALQEATTAGFVASIVDSSDGIREAAWLQLSSNANTVATLLRYGRARNRRQRVASSSPENAA